MSVLVDASVWIEFFRPRPALPSASLEIFSDLLADDQVVIIHPIRSELLSGSLDGTKRQRIAEALGAIRLIDPDWNAPGLWDRIVEMAGIARQKSLPIPGIVDRMVLVAAERAGAGLWTLDRAMLKLALVLDMPPPLSYA